MAKRVRPAGLTAPYSVGLLLWIVASCLHGSATVLSMTAFCPGDVAHFLAGARLQQYDLSQRFASAVHAKCSFLRLRNVAPMRTRVFLRMKEGGPEIDVCGDGGCKKVVLEKGKGTSSPQAGDLVQLEYHISIDGQLIDSSEGVFEFELGLDPSDAIKCWEMAIPTMKEGETAIVNCAPGYAFGEQGAPPKIPPNATVECELKLLAWVNPKAERERLANSYTPSDAPEEDIYDGYKKSIEEPENAVKDLDVNTTNPKTPEVFKLDDPRIRAMTSRQQRVDGKAQGYRWHETEEMIEVYVQVPPGTKARAVQCDVREQSISVAVDGGAPLVQGALQGAVYATESIWGLTDDNDDPAVHVSLRKKPSDQRIWATVFAMPKPE